MRFSAASIPPIMPSTRRSAGTYATPLRTACRIDQPRTSRPSTRRVPASKGSAPKIARHTDSRPEPFVPTIVSIRPGVSENVTSL